jgi:hypothetical protein
MTAPTHQPDSGHAAHPRAFNALSTCCVGCGTLQALRRVRNDVTDLGRAPDRRFAYAQRGRAVLVAVERPCHPRDQIDKESRHPFVKGVKNCSDKMVLWHSACQRV